MMTTVKSQISFAQTNVMDQISLCQILLLKQRVIL